MLHFPKSTSTPFLVPAGTHHAVCYCVADLGTQETNYGKKPQLLIGWEIPEERLYDGRVAVVSRRYSVSADPKAALRIDIESWQGRKFSESDLDTFNFADLVTQCCLVNIQHSDGTNGRIYANVKSVLPAPRGVPRKQQTENAPVLFDLGVTPFPRNQFNTLPEWLQTMIARSPEYAAARGTSGITAREALQQNGFLAGEPRKELPSPSGRRSSGTSWHGDELPSDDIPF